jgi:transposase
VSTAYLILICEMRDAYNHRLRLVQSARQRGIKPTARLFQTTVPTVRKWLRRYQQRGPRGLIELSRAPHHQPGKTPTAVEERVIALRRQLFTFGARRLIREFELPLSHRALERIWRQHGLLKKRQRKYQRKQDLAHIKATWRVFQQISADTKDLNDIPRYWPQAQAFDLPVVEYTAREVRSGLLFWAFAQRRSAAASSVFAARIQQHLDRCGISLRDLVWQTDNGSEFIGGHDRRGHPTGFPSALGDSQHVRIPPAAHTFQSDVETVHRLVEDEFFDLESFSGRGDFLAKAFTYQLAPDQPLESLLLAATADQPCGSLARPGDHHGLRRETGRTGIVADCSCASAAFRSRAERTRAGWKRRIPITSGSRT